MYVALTCLGLWLAAAGEAGAESLDRFLEEFAERRQGVENVQAVFVQDEVSPDDSLRSNGTLIYVRPRRILFRYADPIIAYLVEGLRVYEYDAEFDQVQIFDLGNDPEAEALFLGFGGDPERLKEAYDLSLADAAPDSCGSHVLTLRPKPTTKEIQQEDLFDDSISSSLFEEARLTLAGDELLPCRIEIINGPDSVVVINLIEYEANTPIEPGADRLTVPEGTRIIDNDTLKETVGAGGKVLPEESATP